MRFSIATVLLVVYVLATGGHTLAWKTVGKLTLLGALYGLEAALFFAALERSEAGTVALIFYSFPLFTTVIAVLSGMEKLRSDLAIALTLGSVGVATIFSLSLDEPTGPLFALGAAVSVAIYFTIAQIVLRDVSAAEGALWTTFGAGLSATVAAFVTHQTMTVEAVPWAFTLGVASAFAFLTVFAAVRIIGSSRTSVAAMVEPVATVILAAIFLDERVTVRMVIGAALIVSALPVLARRSKDPVAADGF